jgi:small subunit ribosomal protein S16
VAVKIRLARGGAKKTPYYRLVVANATAPRDGDFLEKVGTYNPLLVDNDANRVTLKSDRILYWLSQGAQPTEKVAKFLKAAGISLPGHIEKKMAVQMKNHAVMAAKRKLESDAKAKIEAEEQAKIVAEAKAKTDAQAAANAAAEALRDKESTAPVLEEEAAVQEIVAEGVQKE